MNKEIIITHKCIYCDHRCSNVGLMNCLECKQYFEVKDENIETTVSGLIDLLKTGNVYITKVETIE